MPWQAETRHASPRWRQRPTTRWCPLILPALRAIARAPTLPVARPPTTWTAAVPTGRVCDAVDFNCHSHLPLPETATGAVMTRLPHQL